MKFILKFKKDCSVPVAWCEVCNTEITDAGMAMVYWQCRGFKLRGKDVVCYCELDEPCHGDILLAIANDWDRAPASTQVMLDDLGVLLVDF